MEKSETLVPLRADFFGNNRAALRNSLGSDGLVVITSNGLLQRTADTTYPFAQESNFYYFTGIISHDVILVMSKSQTYCILPVGNQVRDIFDGALDTSKLEMVSGIVDFYPYKQGWQKLRDDLAHTPHVYTVLPHRPYDAGSGVYTNPAQRRLVNKLRRLGSRCEFRSIIPACTALRMRKQPVELELIRHAIEITSDAIDRVRQGTLSGEFTYEYEVEAALAMEFRRRGASGEGFSSIVANGRHATTLHYVDNSGPLLPGELTVVDVGAEYAHYSADITRVLAVQPLSSRQKEVFDEVRRVQERVIEQIRPGLTLREIEAETETYIGQSLVRLGLIDKPNDQIAIRRYYPHAVSHHLGLDVHDLADYKVRLEAGMVITCEPGIYIREEGIGIRIEDDIVITPSGNQNLSAGCRYEPFRP